ncbi:MucR family transcriptional regulator [bacterium]|nr:MucR family transcriptional regulator [bacterium]MDE6224184.1 MucR family transcriptional regulator [Alphaproteobacteria bacterium]
MNKTTKNISENLQLSIISATSQIVSSYISNNTMEKNDIPNLIETVYSNLIFITDKTSAYTLEPSVDIKDSIHPEYLVCLEDGKKLKMLKRYLKTKYNMTDVEYREKWALPPDYPMIAPNYAKKRSSLAKKTGLGKNKK